MKTLMSKYTGRPTLVIDKHSGAPLIGHNAFGIIDRGTNLLELRPVSGCNQNCIYCSVDEGKHSRTRATDYLVDNKYMIRELRKVMEYKGDDDYEIFISSQGEPLIHPNITSLVRRVNDMKNVDTIIIQTNGSLLTKEKVLELKQAGLDRLSMSINSLNPRMAKRLAGCPDYDLDHVKQVTEYAQEKGIEIMLAPVVVKGYNYDEIRDLALYAKKHGMRIGIQNYLKYRLGRRLKSPQVPMKDFMKKLERVQEETGVQLVMKPENLGIHESKQLPNPFRKGETLKAKIMGPGRIKGNALGAARDRSMEIIDCKPSIGKMVRVRIISRKHNIINAKKT